MPKSDQGVSSDRYQLIPRTLIFVTQAERVLLLKGAPSKRLWANRYNGIGGHVERGEDILNAARRELLEEAGLEAEDLWLCGTVMVDASDQTGIGIFVLRCDFHEKAAIEPAGSKEGQPEWVRLSELENYPLVEDLTVLLPLVLSMRRGDPVFAARSYYDDQERLRVVFG